MHYLMLITLTLPASYTSESARSEVYSRLMDDDSFCGEGGRFGSPLCDWFVIGGRWSGKLSETLIGNAYRKALERKFPQTVGLVSTQWVKGRRKDLDQLWRQHGGIGCSPLTRESYGQFGYNDDAMLVTDALYEHLLAEYAGQARSGDDLHCHFIDLDDEPVDETFIGRKWLVVVDYHN